MIEGRCWTDQYTCVLRLLKNNNKIACEWRFECSDTDQTQYLFSRKELLHPCNCISCPQDVAWPNEIVCQLVQTGGFRLLLLG